MSHQLKRKSETERAPRHHQGVPEHEDLHVQAPDASFAFSPASVMRLQRSIGNQAVMRLMGAKPTGSVQRAPETNDDRYAHLSADALLVRWNKSLQYLENHLNFEKRNADDYTADYAHRALAPRK
jgi:hypothetical protein